LLAGLRGHCAQLDRLAGHVTSFAKMMTRRTGEHELAGWLKRVEADDWPELHTFTAGIRQDLAAVTAGLSLPYSSGPTEGNVNRLKAIKRQMYGRASLHGASRCSVVAATHVTFQCIVGAEQHRQLCGAAPRS
jgi:hypothetical protein